MNQNAGERHMRLSQWWSVDTRAVIKHIWIVLYPEQPFWKRHKDTQKHYK